MIEFTLHGDVTIGEETQRIVFHKKFPDEFQVLAKNDTLLLSENGLADGLWAEIVEAQQDLTDFSYYIHADLRKAGSGERDPVEINGEDINLLLENGWEISSFSSIDDECAHELAGREYESDEEDEEPEDDEEDEEELGEDGSEEEEDSEPVDETEPRGTYKAVELVHIDIRGVLKSDAGIYPVHDYDLIDEFNNWMSENDIRPPGHSGGFAGLGRNANSYLPDDAKKVIEWLESRGVEKVEEESQND